MVEMNEKLLKKGMQKQPKSEEIAAMCGSRKYPYPPHGGFLEIPRGRGVLKAKIFKGKYEPKVEFP